LKLLGFERIANYWKVDVNDLEQEPFRGMSNPEEAYINYIKEHFFQHVLRAQKAVKKMKIIAERNGSRLVLPGTRNFPKAVNSQHERQLNDFRNLLWKNRQRKKRWG